MPSAEFIFLQDYRQEILTAVLAYRDLEEDFGPLYAFKECVDSNRVNYEEKDLAI